MMFEVSFPRIAFSFRIRCEDAMEAALAAEEAFPEVSFGREMTAGHLLLDYDNARYHPHIYGTRLFFGAGAV